MLLVECDIGELDLCDGVTCTTKGRSKRYIPCSDQDSPLEVEVETW